MPVPPTFGATVPSSSGGGAVTTWNPADRSPTLTLSSGNLRCQKTAGFNTDGLVRSTTSKGSGKWHFEVTVAAAGTGRPGIGVANASQSLSQFLGIGGNNSISYFGNGDIYRDAGIIASSAAFGAGSVVAVELDADNDLIFFQKAGSARTAGIDISAISGSLFAALDQFYSGEDATVNFGGSSFTIAPTSGFVAWG